MIDWNIIENKLKQTQIQYYLNNVKSYIEYDFLPYEKIIDEYNKEKKWLNSRKITFYKLSKNIWYSPEQPVYKSTSYGEGYLLDDETGELVEINADSSLFEPLNEKKIIYKKELDVVLNYELSKEEYVDICDKLIGNYLDDIKKYPHMEKDYNERINKYQKLEEQK